MLFFFFLNRFLRQFCLILVIITAILGASNLVLRIQMIFTPEGFFQIFMVMLPLMAIYAVPLSAAIAVQIVIGQLLVEDELLIVNFFKSAYKALCAAVLTFSLILTIFYAPLVFEFAPKSYLLGKKIILELAKKQFYNLEPQKFHSPYPGFTFFFKEKIYNGEVPTFKTIFLAFNNKQNEQFIFTAREGYFQNDNIFLLDGSVCTISLDKRYNAVFKESNINTEKILNIEKDSKTLNMTKFWNVRQLFKKLQQDIDVMWEFLKRVVQILWLFLFPLLGMCFILKFGKKKSNLLIAVSTSGLLFLFSYISIAIAQALINNFIMSVLALFVPILIVIAFVVNILFQKNK